MKRLLRGVGQIFLQRSALAGGLFLLALALADPWWAAAAFIGSALGTEFPFTDKTSRDDGLYGFNAALVALAVVVFFPHTTSMLLIGVAACVFSTALFHFAHRRGLRIFTAPFVVTTWLLFALITPTPGAAASAPTHVVEVIVRHFGEVIFLGGTWPGLLCAIGVFVGSRKSGLVALAASTLVLLLAVADDARDAGLYGFNAVLAAIALQQQRHNVVVALAGAVLAGALAGLTLEWRPLTAPFVLVAWLGTLRSRP